MKKLNLIRMGILAWVLIALYSCEPAHPSASLIILDGTIWTGNSAQPWAEALAVKDEKIIAIGTNDEISNYINDATEIIHLNDAFVSPGFIDAHAHLLQGGFNLLSVQLRDVKSLTEFRQRIIEYAKNIPPGTWILGGGWDHQQWGGVLPTSDWIDEFTPDHPVFLKHMGTHLALANSLAIKLADVENTLNSSSNENVMRDASLKMTGIFKETAMSLIEDKIGEPSSVQKDAALQAAMNSFVENGITSVHNLWFHTRENQGSLEVFERAYENNKLKLRIFDMGSLEDWALRAKKVRNQGVGDHWLKYNGLKGVLDGSLGSHNAAMFEPFIDGSNEMGEMFYSPAKLYDLIAKADQANLQVTLHAIGDRTINTLLNTFEKIQSENNRSNQRFRIEHSQHIAAEDIPRFTQLNVIPSMQPYSAIDDGVWAGNLVDSKLLETSYGFRSLLDTKAKLTFGSDWPVYTESPLMGIYAAVNRITLDGKNPSGWFPLQKITVEEALVAYTYNGAFASFEENLKGTLETGKLADFVVLSQDIIHADPLKIKDARVLQTFVGGKKTYDRNSRE